MSKLETAFSKALKERPPEQSAASPASEEAPPPVGVGQEHPASPDRSMGQLISAAGQIERMAYDTWLSDEELEAKGLIYPRMADERLLNVYRNLRTKVLAATEGRNFTTLVTPVVPDDKSSLVSANIAASFAFDAGKTAMVVEGDIQSGYLSRLFDLNEESRGLLDFLEAEQSGLEEVIHETGVARLRFIPGGMARENSAEYFSSERMREGMAELLSRYPDRFPVVDAPSIQESAEARILMDLCDRVVLVIPYGACSEAEIREAAQTVGDGKLLGVILNHF